MIRGRLSKKTVYLPKRKARSTSKRKVLGKRKQKTQRRKSVGGSGWGGKKFLLVAEGEGGVRKLLIGGRCTIPRKGYTNSRTRMEV